jgi:hypothetical protein
MHRRGEDWLCGTCAVPRRQVCAGCDRLRSVACHGPDGRPRCTDCQPNDDPIAVITAVVQTVDAEITALAIAEAVAAAAPRLKQRRRLAWALTERPQLLTGAAADAPVPTVLHLVELLAVQGAGAIVRPPCPHCGRTLKLIKHRDGQRLCRACMAKASAEPCGRCGAPKAPAARAEDGQPICGHCVRRDPASHQQCANCRRQRPVHTRIPTGPLCATCAPRPIHSCSICTRTTRCAINTATGLPWCGACKQRWARCTGCGQVKRIRGGTLASPQCATCTRPAPTHQLNSPTQAQPERWAPAAVWRACTSCGQRGQQHEGLCPRCAVTAELRDLCRDATGEVHPRLQPLVDVLTGTQRPPAVIKWLATDTGPDLIRQMATGQLPITHAALDELADNQPVRNLRTVLVAVGVLPPRDERLTRLEHWVTRMIAPRADPDERQLLQRYGQWYLLRRLRRRAGSEPITVQQDAAVHRCIQAAAAFLDLLSAHGTTLADLSQGDLDAWLASGRLPGGRQSGCSSAGPTARS